MKTLSPVQADPFGALEDRLSPDRVRQVKPSAKKRRGAVRMVDDFEHERPAHPEWATTDWVD